MLQSLHTLVGESLALDEDHPLICRRPKKLMSVLLCLGMYLQLRPPDISSLATAIKRKRRTRLELRDPFVISSSCCATTTHAT